MEWGGSALGVGPMGSGGGRGTPERSGRLSVLPPSPPEETTEWVRRCRVARNLAHQCEKVRSKSLASCGWEETLLALRSYRRCGCRGAVTWWATSSSSASMRSSHNATPTGTFSRRRSLTTNRRSSTRRDKDVMLFEKSEFCELVGLRTEGPRSDVTHDVSAESLRRLDRQDRYHQGLLRSFPHQLSPP